MNDQLVYSQMTCLLKRQSLIIYIDVKNIDFLIEKYKNKGDE